MDTDGPCNRPRSLSLDIARMSSNGTAAFEQVAAAAVAATTTVTMETLTITEGGACPHLTPEALALIHGQVPPAQKKLMYSNSLRRRSIEVDVQ